MATDRAEPWPALAHDLHALGWAIELHRTVGEIATDHWRTPRYATGRYPVPQVGSGRSRHPITLNEIPVPDKQAIIDVELKTFAEVKPDLSLELRIAAIKLSFDLLVELDLTSRPSYNRDKLLAYDAFLCGWAPRPPPLPDSGHATGGRVRVLGAARSARVRAGGRRGDDRPDRRDGHRPSTGTTPAATTSSSPSRPTSTTATCPRSRCPRSRPDYARS